MKKNLLLSQESVALPRRIVLRLVHQGTVVDWREKLPGVGDHVNNGGNAGEEAGEGALILARSGRPVKTQVASGHASRTELWQRRSYT